MAQQSSAKVKMRDIAIGFFGWMILSNIICKFPFICRFITFPVSIR